MLVAFEYRFTAVSCIASGLLVAGLADAQTRSPKFEIKIERKFRSQECSSGYLSINGKAMCYVLEKPWVDNLPYISSIPVGKYPGFVRTDGSKGWRIELKNVPERTNVQLHIGNTTSDSIGCLLPGMDLDRTTLCRVIDSAAAMKKLRAAFEEQEVTSSSSIPISFVIED